MPSAWATGWKWPSLVRWKYEESGLYFRCQQRISDNMLSGKHNQQRVLLPQQTLTFFIRLFADLAV